MVLAGGGAASDAHSMSGPSTGIFLTTTPTFEGRRITRYAGIVAGDYEVLGASNGMLMVAASGTAVVLE